MTTTTTTTTTIFLLTRIMAGGGLSHVNSLYINLNFASYFQFKLRAHWTKFISLSRGFYRFQQKCNFLPKICIFWGWPQSEICIFLPKRQFSCQNVDFPNDWLPKCTGKSNDWLVSLCKYRRFGNFMKFRFYCLLKKNRKK